MRQMPDCLKRRYQVLDQLIKELSENSRQPCDEQCRGACSDKAAVKLMCDFWEILNEDPDCNLAEEVQLRMCQASCCQNSARPQRITCFMAGRNQNDADDERRAALDKVKSICKNNQDLTSTSNCYASAVSSATNNDGLPLSKVLCNLKEAASFDQKCDARITDLMSAQKMLKEQIQKLEEREKEGIKLLKQADCMWTCMEDAFKKKVADSIERQNNLMKELKEVETSTVKWRKNKKDLESQLTNINKCQQEITEKINHKSNDLKCMDVEIADLRKRIQRNKIDIEAASKSLVSNKHSSDLRTANTTSAIAKLEKLICEQNKNKCSKEKEGCEYVKEGREDLQKICKVLLQKKIENEDLRAEREALNLEIDLLRKAYDQCQDKCKSNQQSIVEEIKKLDKEISEYKVQCIKCHQCTDTVDVRQHCTDCPRCIAERDCLYENEHCNPDNSIDCVCLSVKEKFLDNVFENMYTVLERQAKNDAGKTIGDAVLTCLKKSRNGKLDAATRKSLQDFILNTIKQNLNLTIIGGAVKTRCEMDADTYKQLMLCLKQVKIMGPPKEDKGTAAKKESCRRWGGTSECNCPKGPKSCVCTKTATVVEDPTPDNPSPPEQAKEETCIVTHCPGRTTTSCGPDCAMLSGPSLVGTEVADWKPAPCKESSCAFSKNMRAAQCVLGPEALRKSSVFKTSVPVLPEIPVLDELSCKCGSSTIKQCKCRDTIKSTTVIHASCDKNNCEELWKKAQEEEKIANEINNFDRYISAVDSVLPPLSQSLLKNTRMENDTCESAISTLPTRPFSKDLDHNVVQVIKTKSGSLVAELNKNTIESLEKQTSQNLSLYLKYFDGDNMVIDIFDKEKDDKENEIFLKETLSGSKYLVIKSELFSKLKIANAVSMELFLTDSLDELQNNLSISQACNGCGEEDKINKEQRGTMDDSSSTTTEITEQSIKSLDENIYYKLKIKVADIIKQPPAILQKTPSKNYKIVVDEEFGRMFSKSIDYYFIGSDESNIFVHLQKTDSGGFIINLDEPESSISSVYEIAVLAKSHSGNLKMLVQKQKSGINELNSCKTSKFMSQGLEDFINKLPPRSIKLKSKKEFNFERVSSSDSKLYNKRNLGNYESLLNNAVSLKQTPSGRLIAVIDKETKMNLIGDLKDYLRSCQGLIPIRKTSTGDVFIDINDDFKGSQSSLKITKSGNIYIVVDENITKDLHDNALELNLKPTSVRSFHNIGKVITPAHKAVTTSCQGQCSENSCDVLKCVCKYLQNLKRDDKCSKNCKNVQNTTLNLNNIGKYTESKTKFYDSYKNGGIQSKSEDKDYPHIVIKPLKNRSPIRSKGSDDCYYVVDTVCPFHKDRYDEVSNELLEITGMCNAAQDKTVLCQAKHEVPLKVERVELNNDWDSLNFLPPQLPHFLKNVIY